MPHLWMKDGHFQIPTMSKNGKYKGNGNSQEKIRVHSYEVQEDCNCKEMCSEEINAEKR